ncbi:MAG TPA: hypothetical protein VHW23_29840 [Kofleriaceae bacterium]|jgi:hypothetical protein|nr:hypothetical protein [Kofleriaceae bacterium]
MRWLAVAVAVLLYPAALALANGRAPLTNGIHFQPGDPRSLYVATTFGLLISHDDGCTFRWVCEQDLGYGGTFDPQYRIAGDGTIFATTYTGLRVSRDGGCSFNTATADRPTGDPGRIADAWVAAIDIAPTGDVWVVTANSGSPNDVYRSTDNGATFTPSGLASPTIWWKSVAVAPSRAARIYVSGYQVAGPLPDGGQTPPTTHLQISDDTGTHWQESALAGVQFGPMPLVYVLAVDPTNPDVVLISSSLANATTGDRLYRSNDGGGTWTDVLDTTSPILDLAFEPSGTVVAVTLSTGSFQSADRGASFQPLSGAPQLACIGQRGDGAVFGCAANWDPDFKAVARTSDGATWNKVFRFADLAGPVDCPAGTAEHDTCGGLWPAVQQQFGTTGPSCGVDAPPPDNTQPPPKKSGGCCDAGDASGGLAAIGLAALAGAATRRRRR